MTININKYKREKRTFSGNTRDYRTTCEIISDKDTAIEYMTSFIKDDDLSEKTRGILKHDVPDYFWEKPSSSSGKYHPSDERSKYGLVLHTCRVTKLVDELCVAAQIKDGQKDTLICAAILHDTLKYGDPSKQLTHTTKDHSNLVEKYIPGVHECVIQLIRTHDGQWSVNPSEWEHANRYQKLLHYADYIASRSYVHIRIP